MNTASCFKIDFGAVANDGTTLCWHLDDAFFEALDEQEIEHGSLDATLRVNKQNDAFELIFDITGTVQIPCDRCLEPMSQEIDANDTLQVRLGESFEDEGDVITIPADDPVLDVAWYLFETIVLAIPICHTHPEGECAAEMMDILADHTAKPDKAHEQQPHTDARWDALRSLLDNTSK